MLTNLHVKNLALIDEAEVEFGPAKPQKLLLAITLADIGAERDKRSIDLIIHRIGLRHVRGTFDGDGSLVVCIGRGAPATVFLFNT